MSQISDFRVIDIKPEWIERAKEIAEKAPHRSDTWAYGKDKKRIADGLICQIGAAEYHSCPWDRDTYNWDFRWLGHTYDVKAIACRSIPLDNYWACVSSSGPADSKDGFRRQKVNRYMFARILYDRSKFWLVGWQSSDYVFENGLFLKQGETAPDHAFQAEYAPAIIVPIKELRPCVKVTIVKEGRKCTT